MPLFDQIFNSTVPGKAASLSRHQKTLLSEALERPRKRMHKFWTGNQLLGRKGSIGCVAVEISQRCNLDCSLCYLSSNANEVPDLPLAEVFLRLDNVVQHFGVGTNVQITGGDPTLRDRSELVPIVRYARKIGLNPALFTNGIKCSRDLLEELSANGLSDVAFHVDLTQDRKGYASEMDLNEIRLEYIERARGLSLLVVFNTSVHTANLDEIPGLTEFFLKNADVVDFASFQLQADTGRGRLGRRNNEISLRSVGEKINEGCQTVLPWDTVLIGHPKCHCYVPVLSVNGKGYGLIDDETLFSEFLNTFSGVRHDRRLPPARIALEYLISSLIHPVWYLKAFKYFLPKLWEIRSDLIQARGKCKKISFFIHNFMDKDQLDPERIQACSFMTLSENGPVSMCAYNANRDKYFPTANQNSPRRSPDGVDPGLNQISFTTEREQSVTILPHE